MAVPDAQEFRELRESDLQMLHAFSDVVRWLRPAALLCVVTALGCYIPTVTSLGDGLDAGNTAALFAETAGLFACFELLDFCRKVRLAARSEPPALLTAATVNLRNSAAIVLVFLALLPAALVLIALIDDVAVKHFSR